MSPREMLILVPGVNLDARLFAAQRPHLERNHDVIVADNQSVDSISLLAQKLLRQAPERFALAGMSMGGYIALEVMRQAPERVTRLALIDSSARPDTPEAKDRRARLIALTEGGSFEKTHTLLWDRLVHPDHQHDHKLERKVLAMMRDTGARAFIRQQHAIIDRSDSRPLLGDIAVPTLVLIGREDVITPLEHAQEMADAIPQADLVIIEKSGHLSPLEQPDAVTAALVEWLA